MPVYICLVNAPGGALQDRLASAIAAADARAERRPRRSLSAIEVQEIDEALELARVLDPLHECI